MTMEEPGSSRHKLVTKTTVSIPITIASYSSLTLIPKFYGGRGELAFGGGEYPRASSPPPFLYETLIHLHAHPHTLTGSLAGLALASPPAARSSSSSLPEGTESQRLGQRVPAAEKQTTPHHPAATEEQVPLNHG